MKITIEGAEISQAIQEYAQRRGYFDAFPPKTKASLRLFCDTTSKPFVFGAEIEVKESAQDGDSRAD